MPDADHQSPTPSLQSCRVVLTGGPGGGKSTAADLFRREIGDAVVVVPEAATLLFSGGFPRVDDARGRRAAQLAIYAVQRGLEDIYSAQYPGRILLCDRGTLDGMAYWPGEADEFPTAVGTSFDAELARYDSVIFFESAAVGGIQIEGGNDVRTEDTRRAVELDTRLREIWSRHPSFHLVPHSSSFMAKLNAAIAILHAIVAREH